MITDPENKIIGCYPEFFEDGRCSWNELKLTEKALMKLIESEELVYSMMEDRYIPAAFI